MGSELKKRESGFVGFVNSVIGALEAPGFIYGNKPPCGILGPAGGEERNSSTSGINAGMFRTSFPAPFSGNGKKPGSSVLMGTSRREGGMAAAPPPSLTN